MGYNSRAMSSWLVVAAKSAAKMIPRQHLVGLNGKGLMATVCVGFGKGEKGHVCSWLALLA